MQKKNRLKFYVKTTICFTIFSKNLSNIIPKLWNMFLDSSDPGTSDVCFLPFFGKKTKSYLFHYNKIHEKLKQVSIETCKKK